jgi:exosortase
MEQTLELTPAPANTVAAPRRPGVYRKRRLARPDRWTHRHVMAATIMAALAILATFDAWSDIYLIASRNLDHNEYSHIFLVPFVAAAMVYVRRVRFRYCKPTGTAIGFSVAGLGWCLHIFGFYRNYMALWHLGAVLVLIGCILSVFGKHALFRFFPAFAVLMFLVPVPGTLRLLVAAPMQTWTAQISELLLNAAGFAVTRSGNVLSMGGTPVGNVAEACNGLRMVFALVLVSYFFGFALPLRNSVRFLILLASPLVAIACNVIRILPTVCLNGHYGSDSIIGQRFHDYSGWVMLPISFLILLGIIAALRWAMLPVMRYTLAS